MNFFKLVKIRVGTFLVTTSFRIYEFILRLQR